jgi:hypothetical protein
MMLDSVAGRVDHAEVRRSALPILLVAGLLWGCAGSPSQTAPPTTRTTPVPTATILPTPTPGPSATLDLSGFECSGSSGGASHASDWGPGGPRVVAVRVSGHPGYDRFVIEFDGTVPTYRITLQGAGFTMSPSGKKVVLEGTNGVLIVVKPEDWTAYTGPSEIHSQLPVIREARMVENLEGTMQWGLGILGAPCLRVASLQSPPRLVMDVTSA